MTDHHDQQGPPNPPGTSAGLPDGHADKLISAYLDGTLTDAQFVELSAMLHARPELLSRLAEMSQLDRMVADELSHADQLDLVMVEPGDGLGGIDAADETGSVLAQLAAMEAGSVDTGLVDITDRLKQERLDAKRRARARNARVRVEDQNPTVTHRIVVPKLAVWAAAAAVIFAGLALLSIYAGDRPTGPGEVATAPRTTDPVTAPIATMVYTDRAVWAGGHAPALNSRVQPGPLHLESGIVHLVMDSGAVLMLKGPATVDLTSAWAATLSQGSAVARVPERAQGYQIMGEGFVVTDLGTEFAVRVDADGVQCRVLLGEVELAVTDRFGSRVAVERLAENRLVGLDPATGEVRDLDAEHADDIAWALPYTAILNRNLVENGGFEDGQIGLAHSFTQVDDVAIPGWDHDGPATVIGYEQAGVEAGVGFPNYQTDPVPTDRGAAFYFSRYPGTMTQGVDLSGLSVLTDVGKARYVFSADLGGYITQDDRALLAVVFMDADGRELSRADLEPVDAAARGGRTGFLHRTTGGALPAGTRRARIEVTGVRHIGGFCDGFVDNVSLIIEAVTPGDASGSAVPPPPPSVGLSQAGGRFLPTPFLAGPSRDAPPGFLS